MTKGTKEFQEVQEAFEKIVSDVTYGKSIERDLTTTIKGVWYTNGEINTMFMIYMSGYQFGRIAYMN